MQTVNHVKKTNDYSLFSFIEGNRQINKGQLLRLGRSIREQYIPVPIVVNDKKQIIDGQHRFMTAVEQNKPVYFIEIDGLGLSEVHRLNTNSKNWTADDYMNGYAELGFSQYAQYRNFKKKYGFGHNETLCILSGHTRTRGDLCHRFKCGDFKIKSLDEATKTAEKVLMVSQYYDGYKRRAFVYTMLSLFLNPSYNHTEFLNKLKFQSLKMQDCTNVQQYLTMVEDIYNFKRRGDKIRLF
jgi:hypothetical protein|tara:strand:- start:341 stop:1060 length:720 start_codon:yes stop_codon:yes gene_type:complete